MTGQTFPAFSQRRGTVRGRTWWGRAWTRAMEDTSLDRDRLARGRGYARAGRVAAITVSPGRIAADVHGTADEPYRTVVFVERLTDAEWERFLGEVAARAGRIAALLDRDMPHDLVRAAADAGVRLLPTVGDLEPECDCLDWGYPCKHAAALCYQVAWLLDQDPFVLLLMRGRGESELLADLHRRTVVSGGSSADVPAGVPVAEVYAGTPAPLPELTPPPGGPVVSPALPPAPGVDSGGLDLLVRNAAARARELLAGAPYRLTARQDTVRIAANHPEVVSRPDLAPVVHAWEYGGFPGLETFDSPWTPPARELARAMTVIAADAEEPVRVRRWRNRLTLVGRGAQLRYGRDGRWYPYRQQADGWWPAGPPDRDPVAALLGEISRP